MENNFAYVQDAPEQQENIVGGIVGAFVGASIGAVAWAVVGMLGYIASIIGFVIAFLADKGYDMMKGRQGTIKMVVLILCVVLAVIAGTIGTAVWQIHNEYSALSDIEKKYYYPSESEVIMQMLADKEVQSALIKDSGLGLVFGIMGAIGLLKNAKKGNAKQNITQNASVDSAIQASSVTGLHASNEDTDGTNNEAQA